MQLAECGSEGGRDSTGRQRAIDRLANPARVSDPDKLRSAVSGKTVLVTGASYGIGEATARKLAAAGATVLVVARSAERLDDLAASINAGGGRRGRLPDRSHRRGRRQRADQADHREPRPAGHRGEQCRQVVAPVPASPVRPAARFSAHHRHQLPGPDLAAARTAAGDARQRRRAHRERVERRRARRTRSAVGRLPGIQRRLRPLAAQRVTGTARRRRGRDVGLLRVGPHPDDRAHADAGQASGHVSGRGRRRDRQGDHRAAPHHRTALGVAGRTGVGAAGRARRSRGPAVAPPILRRSDNEDER